MWIIWTLAVGLIVGALAKFVMPGRDPDGILFTTLLGIAGAFLAGVLGRTFGWYGAPSSSVGLVAAVLGAVLLLAVYRVVIGGRRIVA
jgi:uncharacterized membrane protein YeaQ/YmgE (transglycosylase-associated protein family)